MISQEEARARVARGAAHLDQARPGWFNRIDVGTLTLHDPCRCIVGQLVGSFFDLKKIGLDNTYACGERHGFSMHGEDDQWMPLQNAWIELIADRRLALADVAPTEIEDAVTKEEDLYAKAHDS